MWGLLTPEHLVILQHTNCFYSLRNEKFTDERNMPASSGFSSIVTALRTHFGGGDSARQVGSNLTTPYAQRTETMRAFLERIKKEFSKDLNTEWDTWPRQQRRNQVRRFLMGLVKEDYDHSSTPKDEWSQHVDGRLARHHGWVGGLHGHRVVGTAGALIPVSPPPARVWGGLVGGLLGHLRVRGHWGHWAVAFEVSGGLAMMAGRGLETRVGVRGACGDMVTAVGAPVLPDPAATLGGAVWGVRASVLGRWVWPLALVQGIYLVDAHGLNCRPHRGHGHRALPPRRGLLMGSGGVPGRWVGGLGGGRVMGLVDLLLGLDEFGVPGGQ